MEKVLTLESSINIDGHDRTLNEIYEQNKPLFMWYIRNTAYDVTDEVRKLYNEG